MNQHDCEYFIIQHVVTHADRLWQILDKKKIHLEFKKIRFSNITRILINVTTIISSHKIKAKSDKIFIEIFIETFSKIFNKSHITFNDHSDKIKIDQNSVFSSANTIITEKIIFILNVIF